MPQSTTGRTGRPYKEGLLVSEVWISIEQTGDAWRELVRAEDVRSLSIDNKLRTLAARIVGQDAPVVLSGGRDSSPRLPDLFDLEFIEAVGTARQRPEPALVVFSDTVDGTPAWQTMTRKEYAAMLEESRAILGRQA
ncbi:hypothetical protein [Streptomyces sp. NPDC050485]|uniref:hypothetical protein n=1 Tax=Streptomyces sp. NPDC050485 TaxID=3365617 RepID=UPI00378AA81E